MREQELKLEKVKKSCNTARKVAKGFMIFFIVCAVLCIAGAGIMFGFRDDVNKEIKAAIERGDESININIEDFESGVFSFKVDQDKMIENGTYAETMALYVLTASIVCISVAIILGLVQRIFTVMREEGSPFGENVLKRIKAIFIAISIMVGLEIGLGVGLLAGLFFWCLYCILDYGAVLQREVDETL